LEKLMVYIAFMTQRMDMMLEFSQFKPLPRLRLRSFIFMKKKLRQLCDRLTPVGQRVVVGFGDWSNRDVAGIIEKSPASPVKAFERELARYCTVMSIAEYRTSKVHCDCAHEVPVPAIERCSLNQLECIIVMLEHNHTLEYVHIRVDSDVDEPISMETLKQFDHELLTFANDPFSLRCRLAFLIIFLPHPQDDSDVGRRTRSPRETKLAWLAMDRLVLSPERRVSHLGDANRRLN